MSEKYWPHSRTLNGWLEARDKREAEKRMNFWEQWIIGMLLQLLHALKYDPTRIPVLKTVLVDIYDGIGTLLGLPPRTGAV